MPGDPGVTRARRWRELIAATLTGLGVNAEPSERRRGKVSDRIATPDQDLASDLKIDGWSVIVRADSREHWSRHLDAAEAAALADGNRHGMAVEFRRGYDAKGAYVLMSLDGWARLVKEMA